MIITLDRTLVATWDDGSEALVSVWSDGRVEVARRSDSETWGPPAEAVEVTDEATRAANHYEAQVAGIGRTFYGPSTDLPGLATQ